MTHMDANFNFIPFNDINNVTIYDNILYTIQCEITFLFFWSIRWTPSKYNLPDNVESNVRL